MTSWQELDDSLDQDITRHGEDKGESIHDGTIPFSKMRQWARRRDQQIVEILTLQQGNGVEDKGMIQCKEGKGHESHVHGNGPDHITVGPDRVDGGEDQQVVF